LIFEQRENILYSPYLFHGFLYRFNGASRDFYATHDFNYFHGTQGLTSDSIARARKAPRCSAVHGHVPRRNGARTHAPFADNFMVRNSAACRQITEPNRVVRLGRAASTARDAFAGFIVGGVGRGQLFVR